MSDTIIKELLASKIEDYKSGKTSREYYPCSHITVRGVKCQNNCILRPGDVKPKCHIHLKCKEVTQCSYINKDENGVETQCSNLSRSKTGLCHFHACMYRNRVLSKQYYEVNSEKIKKDKRDVNLLIRFDKLLSKIEQSFVSE